MICGDEYDKRHAMQSGHVKKRIFR